MGPTGHLQGGPPMRDVYKYIMPQLTRKRIVAIWGLKIITSSKLFNEVGSLINKSKRSKHQKKKRKEKRLKEIKLIIKFGHLII